MSQFKSNEKWNHNKLRGKPTLFKRDLATTAFYSNYSADSLSLSLSLSLALSLPLSLSLPRALSLALPLSLTLALSLSLLSLLLSPSLSSFSRSLSVKSLRYNCCTQSIE